MIGRRSTAAGAAEGIRAQAIDTVSEVGSRAAGTVSDLAGRAAEAARVALIAAEPVVRTAASNAAERAAEAAAAARVSAEPMVRTAAASAAETLSEAAERAAGVLADAADRLAQTSSDQAQAATLQARERLADASEALAEALRPKRSHRVRTALIVVTVAGGTAAFLTMHPLGQSLRRKVMGQGGDEEIEPASIPLPFQQPASADTIAGDAAATATTPSAGGNGVMAATPAPSEGDQAEHQQS